MKKWDRFVLCPSLFAALPIAIGAPQAQRIKRVKPIQVEMRYQGSPKAKGNSARAPFYHCHQGGEITSNAPRRRERISLPHRDQNHQVWFLVPPAGLPLEENALLNSGLTKPFLEASLLLPSPCAPWESTIQRATRGVFHFQACQGKMCLAPDSLSFQMK